MQYIDQFIFFDFFEKCSQVLVLTLNPICTWESKFSYPAVANQLFGEENIKLCSPQTRVWFEENTTRHIGPVQVIEGFS